METARVLTDGTSQTVIIPHAYRFDVDEVFVNKFGDSLILTPVGAWPNAVSTPPGAAPKTLGPSGRQVACAGRLRRAPAAGDPGRIRGRRKMRLLLDTNALLRTI